MERKSVILVTGPTASGKTATAISIAKKFKTEIISADSRQCFRELNIGVARPSPDELFEVKHHFIASHSVREEVNAARFEREALAVSEKLFLRHPCIVLTGGTGMYIRAFLSGLDNIPEIPASVREHIVQAYNEKGMSWLHDQVATHDPVFMQSGETQNPQRMMRALEVKLATGRSIRELQTNTAVKRPFDTIKLGILVGRDELYDNINERVDSMMQRGLLDEVISLVPDKKLNALNTVGYQELFEHLEGKTSLASAVGKIKTNTRRYAKRQMTWFRKDPEIRWMPAAELIDYASALKI